MARWRLVGGVVAGLVAGGWGTPHGARLAPAAATGPTLHPAAPRGPNLAFAPPPVPADLRPGRGGVRRPPPSPPSKRSGWLPWLRNAVPGALLAAAALAFRLPARRRVFGPLPQSHTDPALRGGQGLDFSFAARESEWRLLSHGARRPGSTRGSPQPDATAGVARPQLYPQRWLHLAYVSLLALLSDWVCFSSAAAPEAWGELYGRAPEELVDLFFLANCVGCFLFTDTADFFGLRKVVVGSASLMAVGCVLRGGLPFSPDLPSYDAVVAGTLLVGFAQPFFLCSPPLLSDTWFGAEERTLATAISLNFNQVGVACAFLAGGFLVPGPQQWAPYCDALTVAAVLLALGCWLQFRDRPPSPPSASTAIREAREELLKGRTLTLRFPGLAWDLLRQSDFRVPLLAFVAAAGVANVISTYTDPILRRAGFTSPVHIGLSGAAFQLAMLVGGVLLGSVVDRTKQYKRATLGCFGVALVLLGGLAAVGPGGSEAAVLAGLLALGAALGAPQPINAELSVETTYPADENAIEALSQLCSNGATVILVPLCGSASALLLPLGGEGRLFLSGDVLVMMGVLLATVLVYLPFNGPLKRSAVDSAFPLRPPD